ncbi:glycosyltransferase family 9 protein [uncultured Helicobacter sp.]|uniref:glycosyltransferase family 9 protein n=1 Tax=uncultured Helicobacter sp. TaxID=175537 RepID=UPI002598CD74|nr:glycosyltransferase family 9 protein [uncultured Helicobacter sp.]
MQNIKKAKKEANNRADTKKIHIGFYRAAAIGDILIAINAIYAIKAIYAPPPIHLVVYTNLYGKDLFSGLDIDEIVVMDNMSAEQIRAHINAQCFNYFIMTQPNRWRCKIVGNTNAKNIISFIASGSWFRLNFHNIFISKSFSKIPHYQRLLRLVREINPRIYDERIKSIDFSNAKLKPKAHNIKNAKDFLAQIPQKTKIMLNPFVRSTFNNLTFEGWIELTKILSAKYLDFGFVINASFNGGREIPHIADNVYLFINNDDLFNLVALLENMDLLIAPSTGTMHFANNLNIPSIGLYSKTDCALWVGENMDKNRLVLLNKTTKEITPKEEEQIIQEVCKKVEEFFANR